MLLLCLYHCFSGHKTQSQSHTLPRLKESPWLWQPVKSDTCQVICKAYLAQVQKLAIQKLAIQKLAIQKFLLLFRRLHVFCMFTYPLYAKLKLYISLFTVERKQCSQCGSPESTVTSVAYCTVHVYTDADKL